MMSMTKSLRALLFSLQDGWVHDLDFLDNLNRSRNANRHLSAKLLLVFK
jgi:hypothetical protein